MDVGPGRLGPAGPGRLGPAAGGRWTLAGRDLFGVADAALAAGNQVTSVSSLHEAADAEPPDLVIVCVPKSGDADQPTAVRAATAQAAQLARELLAEDRLAGARLVFLTAGAVAARPGDRITDLAAAAVWGLIRSAQAEHPGRFILADVDGLTGTADVADLAGGAVRRLPEALALGEAQIAVRPDGVLIPQLERFGTEGSLRPAADRPPWRLGLAARGSLTGLALLPTPEPPAPLAPGQVRVAVRATGLNFRDVLNALGMYPGQAPLGSEGAGVVLETGTEVTGLSLGDKVLGLFGDGCAGPVAVTDARLLARLPGGWSFADGSTAPAVWLTAYYALVELARLTPGQKVLVHAATGGVGMAAVQLARHLGAEVYGTASPGKWPALRSLGLDDEHIASSRTTEFADKFLAATGGRGVDVVLNSLTGQLIDASLRLLPRGGQFIEMGKADIRDPAAVGAERPGISYRSFDLTEAGSEQLNRMLADVLALFDGGALQRLPVQAWDVRRAPDAFRFMSQAKHIGKVALTVPVPLDANGTVLITGGTGTLGSLLARHLVTRHQARRLLLVSRSGPSAADAAELAGDLAELGVTVDILAADVADRDALAAVLARIPAEHPLTAVVHAAGVIDDGVIGSLAAERIATVLRPKADAAWHLHELTRDLDLAAFVLFSSAAGVFGAAGQSSYAAANSFLDALAQYRHDLGLPATSIAWGLWEDRSKLTAHLGTVETSRLRRSGLLPLRQQAGLAVFDEALQLDRATAVGTGIDVRAARDSGERHPLLRGLLPTASRPLNRASAGSGPTLAQQLSAAAAPQRAALLTELIRGHAATVLGHASQDAVDADRAFKELGFDSLTAVELRNRLNVASGLRLPPTVVFDYPTVSSLSRYLLAELVPAEPVPGAPTNPADALDPAELDADAQSASAAEILRLIETELGRGATITPSSTPRES